jgi:hypothetical protein
MNNPNPHFFLKKLTLLSILIILFLNSSFSQSVKINQNTKEKTISFGNEKINVTLDYNKKANISLVIVNGQSVIQSSEGIYSKFKTKIAAYSTLLLSADPKIKIANNIITLSDIHYGDQSLAVTESWTFTIHNNKIDFDMVRNLSKVIDVEQQGLPVFNFKDMNIWEGAYQDYGGLAWFYLFNKKLDTYGVHSSSSKFWNSKTGNGLTISIASPNKEVAMDYSRTSADQLAFNVAISENEIIPRFDSGTKRRLFLRDTSTNVWSDIKMNTGITSEHITLSYFNFEEQYGRGKFNGINGAQVSSTLNTIARIGVIGKNHFGGNSWHTPYGPICLHEQYIAQMGLAINDNTYLKGYQQCLDFYRDNAINADGRVWPRWAYTNEDAMPKIYTDKGFYEARWGYLLDSNPDLVTNVAELYDQTGNKSWVASHQVSCEKALDWILQRDSNGNGLVEMMTDNHQQKKGSDWIDIIWASYENAFVNAKLYHALVLWADIEKQLGNTAKEKYYRAFADKLKRNFNKSTTDGGFWDDTKKCYIHWRDKDGSIHGNNMVTPVNFMAIAYGICDDANRTKNILDAIEAQMQKEKLFFWPLCMYSYEKSEGNDWQFPFANYENGDIFLSWGAVAVKAYASYNPALAIKYVKNVLAQYATDGLAFQRYGRAKQDGLGDDILSGNSLSVVGLYQAIYGINPKYNRFYLDPHITSELAGTELKYKYRDQTLHLKLNLDQFTVSNNQCSITDSKAFGFFGTNHSVSYFNGKTDQASLLISVTPMSKLALTIQEWTADKILFKQITSIGNSSSLIYQVNSLKPSEDYSILINNKPIKQIKSTLEGKIQFEFKTNQQVDQFMIIKK